MGVKTIVSAVGTGLNFIGGIVGATSSKKSSDNVADATLQAARETNATNLQIQQDVNQANKELAEQQNQWNIEQWNRQNEYNSPANQKKLLKDAGLNPVLMSGGNFSPAESLQSADLANQQATQLQNPMSQAGPLQLQGALQASNAIKTLVGDSADVLKKLAETRKTEVETGAIEQITPKQLKMFDAQVRHLNSSADAIDQLTPKQVEELSAKITNFRKQYVLMDKDEKNKELLNESIELQNKLVRAQWDDLVNLPKAQCELALANAFMARAQGNKTNFETGYMKKHGRTVPTQALDQFINLVFDGLDEFGVSPKQIVDYIKEKTGIGSNGDVDSSKSMYELGGSLFTILKGVGTGLMDFGAGLADEFLYFAFPGLMPARKTRQDIDHSQFE